MSHADRIRSLTTFFAQLSAAVGAAELVAATSLYGEHGFTRTLSASELRIGTSLLPSTIPRVVIGIDPPVDARALCAAWSIERPVAVSGDVNQRSWQIGKAGDELPDPCHRRIAVLPICVGRWEVVLRLTRRPAGALPDVVAGASPAYDILERGADINQIEVHPTTNPVSVLNGGHGDAQMLLASMAARYPVWRRGWGVTPDTEFVAVYREGQPIVGGALEHDGQGASSASRFCVNPDIQVGYAGSVLLDALEAMALGRGSTRLTLDESVFLHTAAIPCQRHGYVVAPPYDGDADVTVWAERDLRPILA